MQRNFDNFRNFSNIGGEGETELRNVLQEETGLLHKQLKLLAEKSSNCSIEELVKLTEQMVNIFTVLNES